MPATDPLTARLDRAPLPKAVKAQLWDLYQGSADADDLASKMDAIGVPRSIKADLWDLKAHSGPSTPPPAAASTPSSTMNPVIDAMADAGRGAVAGLASTVYHGGDLIRRGLGMDRIIEQPDVQAAMTAPDSFAGKAGKFIEQGAEFALPLTRLSTAAKGLPWLARRGVDALASAGVAGVQTGGDTGSMEGAAALGAVLPPVIGGAVKGGAWAIGAARRAAAGAKEGGLGGAVAGAIRSAAPVEPRVMLVQALKPRSVNVKFNSSLERAMPELKATEAEIGKPIASIDDLLEATTAAKKRVRAQYDSMAGPRREMGSTVDLSPVADAIEQSIPRKVRLEDPQAAAALRAKATIYRQGRFALEDAEQLLKETNAELDAYYGKYPAAQRNARTANPEIAHTVAQASALRDAIYQTLDSPGQGKAAREIQRRYGALMDVEQEAIRRYNVAQRQQPESLAEQIASAGAMGDLARGSWKLLHGNIFGAADIASARAQRAGAKFLKEQQTTDALIRRAFQSFTRKPTPVEMPPPTVIRGLLNRGPLVTPPPEDPSFVRGVPADYGVREVAGEVVDDSMAGAPQSPAAQRTLPGRVLGAPELPPGPTQRALPPASEPPPTAAASEPPPTPTPAAPVAEAPITPPRGGRAFAQAKARATGKPKVSAERIADGPIWSRTLLDARRNGYTGPEKELQATFTERIRQAQSLQQEMTQSESEYGHEAFLATIRKMGGLKPFTKGLHGEKLRGDFESVVESFGSSSGYGQRGSASIFRKDGVAIDDMTKLLSEDPRWAHLIKSDTDLLDVLNEIARGGPPTPGKPLDHYLRAAGVEPGKKWWLLPGLVLPLTKLPANEQRQ